MVPAVPSVEGLISRAVEHGISVEGLERLLGMHERLKAEAAREAYFEAMTGFQSDCPVIPKTKQAGGSGSYSYRYAPLEVIVSTVSPLLREYGLSYRFDTRFEAQSPAQVVTCIVTHRQGHSESSEFRAPIDSSGRMNVMQQSASSLTYAKRYAFCNAFGILTGDEDDDAQSLGGATQAGRQRPGASRQPAPSSVPGGTAGGPPQAPLPRNPVRIVRSSQGTQDSDQEQTLPPRVDGVLMHPDSAPAETPASPEYEPGGADHSRGWNNQPASPAIRQEAWNKCFALEVAERRARGQNPPPEDVLMPIAYDRCHAWLTKAFREGFDTATRAQFDGLIRVLDRSLIKVEESRESA